MDAMTDKAFRLEETTIDDLHRAIREGRTTVVAVVQHYLARVRAYNGVASALVTQDGAPVPAATGVVRAGRRVRLRAKPGFIAIVLIWDLLGKESVWESNGVSMTEVLQRPSDSFRRPLLECLFDRTHVRR